MANHKKEIPKILGKKFGKLAVLSFAGRDKKGLVFNCVCDCGNATTALSYKLLSGVHKSCGCGAFGAKGLVNSRPDGQEVSVSYKYMPAKN